MDEQPGIQASFGWGVLLITDEMATDAIPAWHGTDQVTRSPTALVLKVRHAVDGDVAVRILTTAPQAKRVQAFDGVLSVPSGRLSVSDADGSNAIYADVVPGDVRVRILCDAATDATVVDVVLG